MKGSLNSAGKSAFFEGPVDRVFFWISLLALGMLLFLTIWRQQQINTAQAEYELLQENHGLLLQQLRRMEQDNAALRQRLQQLEERFTLRERQTPRPAPRDTRPAPRVAPDSRTLFLKKSGKPSNGR